MPSAHDTTRVAVPASSAPDPELPGSGSYDDLVAGIAAGSGQASFDVCEVEEFAEGSLPRRLIRVTMRKA